MATPNQIEANRRNSLKSTGPRTPEGKSASRFNALKTGITAKTMVIPGEDPAELERLAAEYHNQFQPATALERFLVDTLVYADWQLRRLRAVEAQLWNNEIADAKRSFRGLNEDAPLGHVFARAYSPFLLLQRRIDSAERSYYRALTQLQRTQSLPPEVLPPASVDESTPTPELASFFHVPVPAAPAPPPGPPPDSAPTQETLQT